MIKIRFFLKIFSIAVFLNFFSKVTNAQQFIKHSYRFYNNFSVAPPECGPDLTQEASLGSCSSDNTGGNFISDEIPLCGFTRTVYSTNQYWGLMYPNTLGTVTTTYTIQLYLKVTKFNTDNTKYTRIIDFSNGVLDRGIYFLGDEQTEALNFYPNGDVGVYPPYFNTSTYYLLTFTRDGTTGKIDVYVNNTLFTTYNDNTQVYIGTAGTPIYIFRDDEAVECEAGAANFAYIAFTNKYSTQSDVDRVYNDICDISSSSHYSDFSINPATICDTTQSMTVTYTGDIESPGSSGYSFNWDFNGATIISGSGVGPYVIKANSAWNKKIRLIVSGNCANPDTLIQTVPFGPKSTTINKTICNGDTFEGYNSSGTYTDHFTAVNGCDSIRILNLSVSSPYHKDTAVTICAGASYQLPDKEIVTASGIYHDTLSATQGCDSIIITTLTVTDSLHSSLNIQDISCYGANDGQVQFSVTGGTIPYTFKLDGGTTNTNGIFTDLSTGSHSYMITDGIGCSLNSDFTITQPDKIILYVHPVDTSVLQEELVSINASSNYSNATYNWNPPTFLSCSTCPDPTSSPDNDIVYTVIATVPINGNDCIANTTVTIHVKEVVIFLPNSFTPNNDGKNDYFKLLGNKNKVGDFEIQIFDRWGKKVFESADVNFRWNGTSPGKDELIGTYVYFIKYRLKDKGEDEPVLKGNVTLIR